MITTDFSMITPFINTTPHPLSWHKVGPQNHTNKQTKIRLSHLQGLPSHGTNPRWQPKGPWQQLPQGIIFISKASLNTLRKCGTRFLSAQSYTGEPQGSKEQMKTWSWWWLWCWCEEIPHLLPWKVLPVFKAATQPHTALNTADCFGQEYPLMRVLHTQLSGQWDPHFPAHGI